MGLTWRYDEPEGGTAEHEVQQDLTETFVDPRVRYRGTDNHFFLSGLTDGRYFLRVRSKPVEQEGWSDWSTPVAVVVRHHSLSFALGIFALGALVFMATAVFVLTRSPTSEAD